MVNVPRYLEYEDIIDNVCIIKINKTYKQGMSEFELYEATRGTWKRKIESVSRASYCLSVANGIVVEVYEIEQWYPAGTVPMQTRIVDLEKRIEFVGHPAMEKVRNRYIGKSVSHLFKRGEASPIKVILSQNASAIIPPNKQHITAIFVIFI